MEGELRELERNFTVEGFMRAVRAMKADPELARRYGDRLAEIDARRFRGRSVGLKAGVLLMSLPLIASVPLFWVGARLEGVAQVGVFLVATLMLMSTLHTLFHLITGTLLGMRFLYVFLNGPARVEPTLKVHYGTYLRATPLRRALMHLSGIAGSILGSFLGLLIALRTGSGEAAIALGLLFLLNIPFEFSPPLLVRLGFRSFRKSDAYRAFRELRQVRR